MAASHTVLFTVLPRGITVNTDSLPVSVLISPRLVGEDRLGAFPDWVDWTAFLKRGFSLTFECGGQQLEVRGNTEPLEPRLWRALFNKRTFVRSHAFNDYSEHGILSYSVRESLSALKTVYQEASVTIGLPDEGQSDLGGQEDRETNRRRLAEMLDGLDVHWNAKDARRWREVVRHRIRSGITDRAISGPLDGEGLITAPRNAGAFQAVAVPFATFHHMPTPTEEQAGPVRFDPDEVDFHQAISSLGSYPELLRALGLIVDVSLPADFVPLQPFPAFSTLSVIETGIPWQQSPARRPLETACVHAGTDTARLFFTATRTQLAGTPSPLQVLGLLNLDPERYGLAQVDVDGAMHKVMTVAEITNRPDPGRNLYDSSPEAAPNPEVFDQDATLPSMRSSGLQLYVDRRGAAVLDTISQSKAFNAALESGGAQPRPFFAEDLVRGYRLDVWESRTDAWHSLHRRSAKYEIGEDRVPFATEDEEGFFELATTQPAPGADPAEKDLYVHEVIARWAGWSLSVPFPGKALSHYGDPADAVLPNANHPTYETDEPVTAFKVRGTYSVIKGSLPRLRFGSRYRVRARAVDLAGNSLDAGAPLANGLAAIMGLPRDLEGLAYLRYEPVAAPLVVIRDEQALTLPGSAVHRLVIRTANAGIEQDEAAADLTAADRHIVPPRTSVEMAERHGMLDGPDGKLKADAATWQLAADRDAGRFSEATVTVAGQTLEKIPLEPAEQVDALPHLPDPFSRGAALRDLPGSTTFAIGRVAPDPGGAAAGVAYDVLSDPNPRSGSATLVSFNGGDAWQQTAGFRLVLAEPAPGETGPPPLWDPAARVLTVFLGKGRAAVVPLSSYATPADLALMGQWKWMREYVDLATIFLAAPNRLLPGQSVDRIAHVLQRAVEGGHWMLTPPTLLTLVHAVQQPIGRPAFAAVNVERDTTWTPSNPLQTGRVRGRTDPEELTPITAWRRPGETTAFLMGALRVHGASTAKIEVMAAWTDPVDLPDNAEATQAFDGPVEELPLPRPREGYLLAKGAAYRPVGYYDPEHDQIVMVRTGDKAAKGAPYDLTFTDAAPRHELGDTKRHLVHYRAIASSRYREYFPQDQELDFTRPSEPILVDVPASARPLAPDVVYVVPTFGWQRQTGTNLKRSVRFGGGLRVYLRRPWFSSGVGELLGVALWSGLNGALDEAARDKFKPFFTQWGMDPIWKTATLSYAPGTFSFPDAVEQDYGVSLEESSAALPAGGPGRVDVVGYSPQFDKERGLWFADLTIDTGATYSPFVRLALVRFQPHALDDARISRVVLADFAQLTPDRTATVTADPHHPRTLRITVSGLAPTAPPPLGPGVKPPRPTHVNVRVQRRTDATTDLGWADAPEGDATVTQLYEGSGLGQPDLALWIGGVTFTAPPPAGTYRLLIEEFEYITADYMDGRNAPGRLIYAETFDVDAGLL